VNEDELVNELAKAPKLFVIFRQVPGSKVKEAWDDDHKEWFVKKGNLTNPDQSRMQTLFTIEPNAVKLTGDIMAEVETIPNFIRGG
jgi:hypothetical protein